MLGGAWFRQSFGDPAAAAPELLLSRARAAVSDHLGLAGTPARAIVRVQQVGDASEGAVGARGGPTGLTCVPPPPLPQDCIPQYTLGHWERLGKRGAGGGGPCPSCPPPGGVCCPQGCPQLLSPSPQSGSSGS